ncbi:hypothetical protein FOZ61_007695 [Perkinsus olseni]|uniref:Uncharacterized protein n=1 Tax=Perkinsus olseni TaxID=32597 RepID=A0A7J6M894_PEROL|nr:hypothetical protein FOZ61_007695 [Perkinsus olseni]KAF4673482.1 hypothetical protein FOL46_007090 [Perkinsus olseni]
MEIRDLSEDKSPSSTSPRQIGILLYNALVFAAGGVVAGIAIWYLQAKFRRLMQVWYVWIALFMGFAMMILSVVEFFELNRRHSVLLMFTWMCWAGVCFALVIIACGSSVYYATTTNLTHKSAYEIDYIHNADWSVYDHIRWGFGEVWNDQGCDVSCDVGNTTVSCSSVKCANSDKVEKQMNAWMVEGNYQTTGVSAAATFTDCMDETILTTGMRRSQAAAEGWCASNASVVDEVSHYALGATIGLWVALLIAVVPMVYDLYLLSVLRKRRPNSYAAHQDDDEGEEEGGVFGEEEGPIKTPPQTVTVVRI